MAIANDNAAYQGCGQRNRRTEGLLLTGIRRATSVRICIARLTFPRGTKVTERVASRPQELPAGRAANLSKDNRTHRGNRSHSRGFSSLLKLSGVARDGTSKRRSRTSFGH